MTIKTVEQDLLPLFLETPSTLKQLKTKGRHLRNKRAQCIQTNSPPSHCRDDLQNKKPWIPAILLASESLQGFPETKQNKGSFVSQLLTL